AFRPGRPVLRERPAPGAGDGDRSRSRGLVRRGQQPDQPERASSPRPRRAPSPAGRPAGLLLAAPALRERRRDGSGAGAAPRRPRRASPREGMIGGKTIRSRPTSARVHGRGNARIVLTGPGGLRILRLLLTRENPRDMDLDTTDVLVVGGGGAGLRAAIAV